MKIIKATVVGGGDAYEATVVILDEGCHYNDTATGDNPNEALHHAFSNASRQITDACRKKLGVRHEVTF